MNAFRCGEPFLDFYLHNRALYYGEIGEAKTHVLLNKGKNKVIGYFTIKCSSLKITVPEMGDPKQLPSIEIARFAIHIDYHDQDIGQYLLAYALNLINELKEKTIGVRIITLFATTKPKVIAFYKKFQFEEADDDMEIYCIPENEGCTPMYLEI